MAFFVQDKAKREQNEREVKAVLEKAGYSPAQVDAVMQNIRDESGFDTEVVGDKSLGPGREAQGLAQWREGRQEALQDYAKSVGKPHTDATTQAEFLVRELEQRTPGFKNLQDPEDLAQAMRAYEGYSAKHAEKRQNNVIAAVKSGTFSGKAYTGAIDMADRAPGLLGRASVETPAYGAGTADFVPARKPDTVQLGADFVPGRKPEQAGTQPWGGLLAGDLAASDPYAGLSNQEMYDQGYRGLGVSGYNQQAAAPMQAYQGPGVRGFSPSQPSTGYQSLIGQGLDAVFGVTGALDALRGGPAAAGRPAPLGRAAVEGIPAQQPAPPSAPTPPAPQWTPEVLPAAPAAQQGGGRQEAGPYSSASSYQSAAYGGRTNQQMLNEGFRGLGVGGYQKIESGYTGPSEFKIEGADGSYVSFSSTEDGGYVVKSGDQEGNYSTISSTPKGYAANFTDKYGETTKIGQYDTGFMSTPGAAAAMRGVGAAVTTTPEGGLALGSQISPGGATYGNDLVLTPEGKIAALGTPEYRAAKKAAALGGYNLQGYSIAQLQNPEVQQNLQALRGQLPQTAVKGSPSFGGLDAGIAYGRPGAQDAFASNMTAQGVTTGSGFNPNTGTYSGYAPGMSPQEINRARAVEASLGGFADAAPQQQQSPGQASMPGRAAVEAGAPAPSRGISGTALGAMMAPVSVAATRGPTAPAPVNPYSGFDTTGFRGVGTSGYTSTAPAAATTPDYSYQGPGVRGFTPSAPSGQGVAALGGIAGALGFGAIAPSSSYNLGGHPGGTPMTAAVKDIPKTVQGIYEAATGGTKASSTVYSAPAPKASSVLASPAAYATGYGGGGEGGSSRKSSSSSSSKSSSGGSSRDKLDPMGDGGWGSRK